MSPRRARAVAERRGEDPATALREHLVASAERLLAERPASGITTRDISSAAGVSDGVLYNYFTDKQDLLLAALLRRYAALMKRFEEAPPEAGAATVEENLDAFARAFLEVQAGVMPLIAGLLTEPALLRRFIDEIHAQPLGPRRTQEKLAHYLEGEQRAGRVPAGADPAAIHTLLMGASAMIALAGLIAPSETHHSTEQLPAIVETLMRGLSPRS